jgi:hypothetical protein
MEDLSPILRKLKEKLDQFASSKEVLKWMDILAREGVWIDFTLEPKGPGLYKGSEPLTISSPLKEEVLCRMERWVKDYDGTFLKANRIKIL